MAPHRLWAAAYERFMAVSEARGLADRRHQLLASAHGRTLEIGAGTGLNLRHYRPEQVSSLVALEPDGAMRRRLSERAAALPLEVVASSVADAPFDEASFDTVVSTLVLCTVGDPEAVAGSIHGWLKPGGRLLFLEHVGATGPRGAVQRAATPLWSRLAGGCHLDRDTLTTLRHAGLVVSDCERFALPAGGPLMRSCVAGVAWRPPVGADAMEFKLEGAL